MEEKKVNVGNVPNLRFPGFEGEWEERTLEELSTKIGDGLHGTPVYAEGTGYYFINGNNLTDGAVRITTNTKEVSQKDWLGNDKKFNSNTLFLSINGTIGNVARYQGENLMLGKSVAYINFKQQRDYYFHVLSSQKIQNYFTGELTGSTIKNLSLKAIRETVINVPSSEEQSRISNLLSLIDDRIRTQSKIIEDLKVLSQSLIQQFFAQNLTFKNSDETEWTTKRISEVLTIGSGRDYKHLKTGDTPVFGTGGYMTSVDQFLHDGETVCIGRKGTIDKPMYYNGKIWTVDTLFYTHSFRGVLPKFIFYAFRLINWKEYNEASGVPSLSKSTIEKIEIDIPPINIQHKIVAMLSLIDVKVDNENAIFSNLQKQKSQLLKSLFI